VASAPIANAPRASAPGGIFAVNGRSDTFNPIYFSPVAGNASFTLEIGANGAGIQKLTSGSRIAIVCAWERVALTQGQIEAFRQATRPRFGV
jgi:hypothetical protein